MTLQLKEHETYYLLSKVEWLEGPHQPKNYSIDDLKSIAAHYNAESRKLERGEV